MSNSKTVVIIIDGDSYKVIVNDGESILDAALDKEIDIPYSCQSGVCTACMAQKILGDVHMDVFDGLSDDEIEDGYILTCQATPTSDNVRIEID